MLNIRIQFFMTRKIVWNIDKDEFQIHKNPHFNLILFDLKIRFRVIKLKLQVFHYSVFHHNVEKNDEEPNLEIFNCETLFVQKRRMIAKNHFPWRLRIHHCTNKIAFFRKSSFFLIFIHLFFTGLFTSHARTESEVLTLRMKYMKALF